MSQPHQRAWRETAVLFDQTHHMAELTVRGPDALKLRSHTTINSFNQGSPHRGASLFVPEGDPYKFSTCRSRTRQA